MTSPNFVTTMRDVGVMNKTTANLYNVSYQRLHELQEQAVTLQRSHCMGGELQYEDYTTLPMIKEMKVRYIVGSVGISLIDYNKRDKYFNKTEFSKILSYTEITADKDTYKVLPLIFIHGSLVTVNVNFIISEETLYILFDDGQELFPGNPSLTIENIINNNYRIDVIGVKNGGEMITGLRTPYQLVNNIPFDLNELRRENGNTSKLSSTDSLVMFNGLETGSKILTSRYPVGVSNLVKPINNKVVLTDYTKRTLVGANVRATFIDLPEVVQILNIPANTRFFTTEKHDMPLSIKNMLIFRANNMGEFLFDHTMNDNVIDYYNSIYEFKELPTTDVRIIIFASDNCYDKSYVDYSRVLWKYKTPDEIIEMYNTGTISPVVKEYMPYGFDYHRNSINIPPLSKDTEYREQFKLSLQNNNDYLREYIHCKLAGNTPFTNLVVTQALRRRKRRTSAIDAGDLTPFAEPHLVFTSLGDMEKYAENGSRLWINGILQLPDIIKYSRDGCHLYYKESLFTDGDILIYEAYYPTKIEKTYTFNSLDDEYNLSLHSERGFLYSEELFLVNAETMEYIDISKYSMSVIDKNGNLGIIGNPAQIITGEQRISIKILDAALIGVPLTIKLENISVNETVISTEDGDVTGLAVKTYGNIKFNNRLRLFIQGRRMPPMNIRTTDFTTNNSNAFISCNVIRNTGWALHVHTIPLSYRMIYHNENMSPKGYIDLKDIVDKPFDLRWFEVYLNGRRLSRKNVEYLSATKFIVKDVESTFDLVVYDTNMYSDNEWEFITEDMIEEVIVDDILPDILDKIPDLPNTEPDANGDTLPWDQTELEDFLDWVSTQFINPNILQVEPWMKEIFGIVFWYTLSPDDINMDPNHDFETS